jgi:chemotaxis protein CheD
MVLMEEVRKEEFIFPGGINTSTKPQVYWTVLGSCVSVILYDVEKRYVGMNHYMLPIWMGRELSSPMYGDVAINRLINKMKSHGSKKEDLKAWIVGGAERTNKTFKIGRKNIQIAINILREHDIAVACRHTGGEYGRKVKFFSDTGQLYLKKLNEAPQQIEKELMKII